MFKRDTPGPHVYLCLLWMMTTVTANADNPNTWTNPIVPERADPHVLLHTDGYYYMTATVPAYDRIELRRAKTIGGLADAEAKTVWRKHETGAMGSHIWAPETHYIDGKWYIYFTAGTAEDIWAIRLYVLENASPNPMDGEWAECGQLKTGWESFSLDATTFEHRGKRYLVWTQRDENKPKDAGPAYKGTHIYIALMDSPTSITGKQVMLTRPEYGWERIGHWVNEGPAVLERHGKLFMTYSASATDANYCMGMLAADGHADPLDPASWTKCKLPVMWSNAVTGQFGPGHNSFTTTPDGKTDIVVYHDRNYEKITGEPLDNPDRATRAQAIRWTDDGWPDFGPPVADGPYSIDEANARAASQADDNCAYLFTYFIGNGPGQEQVYYAVSEDGFNFRALNGNKPVVQAKAISRTGGVRDPYLCRGEDGKTFYMVLTDLYVPDMGWRNDAMVMMKSNDLVHWEHSTVNIPETFPDRFGKVWRVWAPQVIYDRAEKKYMVYFSMKENKDPDKIYYAYANDDFTGLSTVPKQLYEPPPESNNKACIDADIVEKDGKFYLFYKAEDGPPGIRLAVSDHLTHGYKLQSNDRIDLSHDSVEGSGTFKLNHRDGWIMMYDVYTKGRYEFIKTTDLKHFEPVEQGITMDFHPRHGSVVQITRSELNRLIKQWGR